MYLDDHIEVRRPLTYWKELLNEWVFLVNRVYRISGGQASVYAEKERANTGLLAAAATRNGWVALEECRAQKRDRYLKSTKYNYNGRCDLMIWRDKRHHIIEAKFARQLITARSNSKIEKAHRKAIADSIRSTSGGYKSEKMIAISYLVPVITPNQKESMSTEEIASRLKETIVSLRRQYRPNLFSYAFPGPVALQGSNNFGLGVILIGQIT